MRNAVLAAMLLAGASPAALAAGCDGVVAAHVRAIHTSYVSTARYVVNGHPLIDSITIVIGGKRYSKMTSPLTAGDWTVEPWDEVKEESYYRQMDALGAPTCRAGGSETLGGVAADIIVKHDTHFDGTAADWRLWVAHDSGLPLRERSEDPGGKVFDRTWRYDDVQAPDIGSHQN